MANYLFTNDPGTARKRAKQLIITNPSGANWIPKITFIEEERIIMADGSERFIDAGSLTVSIDQTVLAKVFPQYNVETGETTLDTRQGTELLVQTFQGLADVYITLATERDTIEQAAMEAIVQEDPPTEPTDIE